MRTFNDQPRPRALLEDLDDDLAERLVPLFPPSTRRIQRDTKLYEAEADVLITTAQWVSRESHLHVVAFGSSGVGAISRPADASPLSGEGPYTVHRTDGTLASQLHIPADINGDLGALVQTYLVPYYTAQTEKPTLVITHSIGGEAASGAEVATWCRPFLLADDGSVLAGSFPRRGGGQCWMLPSDCPAPEMWVAAALKEFREVDPERVPALPGWWERPDWGTLEQRNARAAVVSLEAERAEVLRELDQRAIAAQKQVTDADDAAATGAGRLLTDDGDSLAEAVKVALEALKFDVEDMDQVNPAGKRLEDLRVRDPDAPEWEAIVEVKGYTRGAAVKDLQSLYRWAMHYGIEKHRAPDARWHVVNAFRGMDPSARPVAMPTDDDLHDFTEDGGLLIDTRDLFALQRAAAEGTDVRPLREHLRTTRGRFAPAATSTDDESAPAVR